MVKAGPFKGFSFEGVLCRFQRRCGMHAGLLNEASGLV